MYIYIYIYTDQILLSNSFDSSQNSLLNFFLPLFLKSFDSVTNFLLYCYFYVNWQFVSKMFYSISNSI